MKAVDARTSEILRLRQESRLTLAAIGRRYGISRQAVHQLVSRHAWRQVGRVDAEGTVLR